MHFPRSIFRMLACSLVFAGRIHAGDAIASEKEHFKIETVAEGLDHPWAMVKLPDGRMLVTERAGRLRIIENGKLLPKPVEGLPPIHVYYEAGLLDIELHPDYAKNGWIYFSYVKGDAKGSMTAVARARLDGNKLKDVQTIFDPPASDYSNTIIHYGSRLEFQDGRLFFSIGERNMRVDLATNPAQKLDSARGKVHRVNDDGSIPEDNPFVHTKGALPSIWTLGNRNPQGLRVQPGTGVMWESEHGPRGGDELNILKKGANYGWPLVTFGINYDGSTITDKTTAPGMEDPMLQWTPSVAVSGIDFYTGDKFPAWKGNLFAATLLGQKLVRIELDKDNRVAHQEFLLEGTGRIRDVLCFDDGDIYVVYDEPGKIIKLVPAK
jgi:glucose/arabinose dehydrogenase